MQLALANTKLSEVVDFFTHQGLKDQNQFGEMAKKKANLRKSLDALQGKDAFDCYTGKGILSVYENDINTAVSNFKKAYDLTGGSLNSAMNYANILMLTPNHELAIDIYLQAMSKAQNNIKVFSDIFKSLCSYVYLDEIKKLTDLALTRELNEDQKIKLEISKNINSFFNKIDASIDIFRMYRSAADSIFYKYFTITSSFKEEVHFDSARAELSITFFLPINKVDEKIEYLLGQMNDEFQDLLLKKRKESFSGDLRKFREASKHINLYFGLDADGQIDKQVA
jgi:tetratricopeptide (TPR) repeat protein